LKNQSPPIQVLLFDTCLATKSENQDRIDLISLIDEYVSP